MQAWPECPEPVHFQRDILQFIGTGEEQLQVILSGLDQANPYKTG